MNTIDKIRRFFYTPKIVIGAVDIDDVSYHKFCDGQLVEFGDDLFIEVYNTLLEEKRKERFGE